MGDSHLASKSWTIFSIETYDLGSPHLTKPPYLGHICPKWQLVILRDFKRDNDNDDIIAKNN